MTKARRFLPVFFLFLSLGVLTQGCVFAPVGPGVGDLEARWFFDGAAFCPGDVADVEIVINGQDVIASPCEEGGRRIPDFAPGVYDVQAVGRDIDGFATWSSNILSVTIFEGGIANLDLNLLPN